MCFAGGDALGPAVRSWSGRFCSGDESRYQELMQQHHYLGALPKISETLWYVATWREEWVALLSFSASALKCAGRDRWIGWNFRQRYSRLKLVVNNSRFLILPTGMLAIWGRGFCRSAKGVWRAIGKPPSGMACCCWKPLSTRSAFAGRFIGRRTGYTWGTRRDFAALAGVTPPLPQSPKMVFVQPLRADAGALLSQAVLPPPYQIGGSKIVLSAAQMQSLPAFFRDLPDPRRAQGRRHRLSTVLGIAAGAVLCGMRGYRAIADWAQGLGPKARERFGCRREEGRYVVPSESIIRNVLIRVDPAHLDRALRRWNEAYAGEDESLAIDGKTMCNALDEEGRPTHVMSVVGHQTQICYTQKKSAPCP